MGPVASFYLCTETARGEYSFVIVKMKSRCDDLKAVLLLVDSKFWNRQTAIDCED
jgi:hypothetical protein